MPETPVFDFNTDIVAKGYDDVLAPVLFEPWARDLLEEHANWRGRSVLDLATGTGVVAQLLASHVGRQGRVVGVDINSQMLARARKRSKGLKVPIELAESSAQSLKISNEVMDVVVCQQGFQFFPEGSAAAEEIHRVLRRGGCTLVSTWRPVAECELFGAIVMTLETIEEPVLASQMRVPFDLLGESELAQRFEEAGFIRVSLKRKRRDLRLEGGAEHAVRFAYATPIGLGLRALSADKQLAFRKELIRRVGEIGSDPTMMGAMTANVLRAEKRIGAAS